MQVPPPAVVEDSVADPLGKTTQIEFNVDLELRRARCLQAVRNHRAGLPKHIRLGRQNAEQYLSRQRSRQSRPVPHATGVMYLPTQIGPRSLSRGDAEEQIIRSIHAMRTHLGEGTEKEAKNHLLQLEHSLNNVGSSLIAHYARLYRREGTLAMGTPLAADSAIQLDAEADKIFLDWAEHKEWALCAAALIEEAHLLRAKAIVFSEDGERERQFERSLKRIQYAEGFLTKPSRLPKDLIRFLFHAAACEGVSVAGDLGEPHIAAEYLTKVQRYENKGDQRSRLNSARSQTVAYLLAGRQYEAQESLAEAWRLYNGEARCSQLTQFSLLWRQIWLHKANGQKAQAEYHRKQYVSQWKGHPVAYLLKRLERILPEAPYPSLSSFPTRHLMRHSSLLFEPRLVVL